MLVDYLQIPTSPPTHFQAHEVLQRRRPTSAHVYTAYLIFKKLNDFSERKTGKNFDILKSVTYIVTTGSKKKSLDCPLFPK
jgi:hypothetical protein